MSNTLGRFFRLTDFGESHGPAIGGVIDGMPPGVPFDSELLDTFMRERRPGYDPAATARREEDDVEILSGINDGFCTGAPIGFIIRNKDARSGDYNNDANPRPNHADYTYNIKYAGHAHRAGGGRSSGRQTACRVVAGAFAMMGLRSLLPTLEINAVLESPSRDEILAAARAGDSLGGIVSCNVRGVPAGLGQPVYGKLHALLAQAMMSINAVHGFEYGDGFALGHTRGSEVRDEWTGVVSEPCSSNHSGGIQGGISNGMPITFRVAFKPTPTFALGMKEGMRPGRHDPCVALRGVPVVKAMTAIVLFDALLAARAYQAL